MSPQARAARERMLDGLRRRNPEGTATIARRSATVTLFKKLLPAAAVLLLVALAAAPSLRGAASRVTYHVADVANVNTASHMSGAKYHGIDQRGQPFTLTADAATDKGGGAVALRQPEGDMTLNSGAWLMLKSDAGLFQQNSQKLGLAGNVMLYRNDGTTMTAAAASIDLRRGDASSAVPVQVQGPFGTLKAANGFSLTDRGANILFKGPASLTLMQAGAAGLAGASSGSAAKPE